MTKHIGKSPLNFHWAHWLVVLSSLVITVFAWKFSSDQNEEKIRNKFDREADHTVELIIERLQKYEDALWSGVAAINTLDGDVSHSQWRTFSNTLNVGKKYPGINGIGVIYHLDIYEKEEFLKKQRSIRSRFRIHPAHELDELWPITFIEPEQLNAKAVGLDMAHENNRLTAARNARDKRTAQITGPIVLVQDSGKTPGFLFYAPFYKKSTQMSVGKDEGFVGLVYAPFVVKNLMRGVLNEESRHISLKITDGDEILFDESISKSEWYDDQAVFKKTIRKSLYGRQWNFELQNNKTFVAATASAQPLIILFGGIIIDSLLFFLFLSLSRSNQKALSYAQKMYDEAERQRGIALNSAKLASLGEMAGGVAHEINNPLAIISATLAVIKIHFEKDMVDRDWVLKHLDKLEKTVTRISRIIKSMRSLSRDGKGDNKEVVSVNELVEESLDICREKFKSHGVDLRVSTPKPMVFCQCRRIEISQVLINLLNNAYDAVKSTPSPWIQVAIESHKGFIKFSVSDSGKPPEKNLEEKIMQPFFTTKKVGEGTGLGLSISKSIVEGHGGQLFLDRSQPNTTFVFEIPIQTTETGKIAA